jgi:hypothetical protein
MSNVVNNSYNMTCYQTSKGFAIPKPQVRLYEDAKA